MKNQLKTTLFFILFCFLFNIANAQIPDTIRQNLPLTKEQNPDSMIVKFQVLNEKNQKVAGVQIRMHDKTANKIYVGKTDDNAIVRFLLPVNRKYIVGIENIDNYREYTVKYQEGIIFATILPYVPSKVAETDLNDTITQQLPATFQPTSDRAKVMVALHDYDARPVVNETVWLAVTDSKKVYKTKTDKYGLASFLLPVNKKYTINLKYEPELTTVDLTNKKTFFVYQLDFKYLGSDVIEKRAKERARKLRERDSLYELELSRMPPEQAENDFLGQLHNKRNKTKVIESIEKRALREREELKKDPNYFVKTKQEINSVLYRMKDKWTDKIIVADITGSMYPYLDQILVWQVLKFSTNQNEPRVFFNDGDETPDDKKIIGKTGGIYFTKAATLDSVLDVMSMAMFAGGGGDGPENNMEAILYSASKKGKNTELIMIADNYADVKDISLLKKVTFPVRIILCGVNESINEDYLEIAYRTNGSVHTIEKDITELSKSAEGSVITIGAAKYRFNRGKFILIR